MNIYATLFRRHVPLRQEQSSKISFAANLQLALIINISLQ